MPGAGGHHTQDIPAGHMIGLIGPDGVGKSSLLSLIAGARRILDGRVDVLGGDTRSTIGSLKQSGPLKGTHPLADRRPCPTE